MEVAAPDLTPFLNERKFLLDRAQAEAILAAIAPHVRQEIWDPDRPIAYNRTTYLDTDAMDLFRSSETEVSRRLRLREYAAAPTGGTPVLSGVRFLEYKESAGGMRRKIRVPVPPEALDREKGVRFDWLRSVGALEGFGAVGDLVQSNGLAPRATTFYRRASLVNAEHTVRVTLDEGVVYCQPLFGGVEGDGALPDEVVDDGPQRVFEIKYQGAPPPWLFDMMRSLPRAEEYSKFRQSVLAIERVGGTRKARHTRPITIPSGWVEKA